MVLFLLFRLWKIPYFSLILQPSLTKCITIFFTRGSTQNCKSQGYDQAWQTSCFAKWMLAKELFMNYFWQWNRKWIECNVIASQSEKEPNYSPLIANVQPLQSPQSGRLDQSGSESGYPKNKPNQVTQKKSESGFPKIRFPEISLNQVTNKKYK